MDYRKWLEVVKRPKDYDRILNWFQTQNNNHRYILMKNLHKHVNMINIFIEKEYSIRTRLAPRFPL